ncbi:MAG: cupin domain-containing protein [Cardiobacteriaceae bacterium]|nr:cupin domain-containing protein [Cardiobacteriaceae bacterium]
MKKLLCAALIATILPALSGDMAGKILNETGKVFTNEHGTVVRKRLKAGENIKRHNHEGDDVIFCVTQGQIRVTLNDSEEHLLKDGDVIQFNGKNYISAEAVNDTKVVITLIKE